jgi:hypothetical protein
LESPTCYLGSVVRLANHVVSCHFDTEAAILNVRTGIYYGLDEVGAAVWRLLTQPRTVADVIDAIQSEYEVDEPKCERDIIRLLGDLVDQGLVEIGDGPTD